MSHFTVMVIGADVDDQLAPYHEFECTGENDQYVVDVDITDEVIADMAGAGGSGKQPLEYALDYHGLSAVSDESELDTDGEHKYGYAIVQDESLVKAVRRTNPNHKWDWYLIGGRWTGFFKLLPTATGVVGNPGAMTDPAKLGWADQCRKGDIDWTGMRQAAADKAADFYDQVVAIAPGKWESWESVRSRFITVESAREFYRLQPGRVALSKSANRDMLWASDAVLVSREEYIQQARDHACITFAFVKDGKWIERGEMGWFGMSTDLVDQTDWVNQVNNMLDQLPDDTLITLVDCHT